MALELFDNFSALFDTDVALAKAMCGSLTELGYNLVYYTGAMSVVKLGG